MKKIWILLLAVSLLIFSTSCVAAWFLASPVKSSQSDRPDAFIEEETVWMPDVTEPLAQEEEVLPLPDGYTPDYVPVPEPVPACPGPDVCDTPADPELIEVYGLVKEVNDGLVLISLIDEGADFMLRFSENSKFAEGIDTNIKIGNALRCLVKPEPTFAAPSQGEVYEVLSNKSETC